MGANFPFLGGSFNGRSPSFDAQRTVNLYAETSESGSSRSVLSLIGTPGLLLWATLSGAGPIRAMIAFSDTQAIVVCGTAVYSFTTAGVATLLTGAVLNSSATVSLASNGQVIMMVTGGADGYFINPATKIVTPITDPDFVGGSRVDYIDGYFVWAQIGSGKFQVTQLYGQDIDALDYATAEGAPDPLVTCIVDHREVWLLGTGSGEVWYDAGGADFPMQRIQGAFLEIGCAAAYSVAKIDNSIFWLARDDRGYGTIQRAAGYTPTRVSNHAVEFAIASYSTISDAVAFTYSQEGHSFYQISFPTAGATWCLDVSTGLWHERTSYYPTTGYGRHRANCQMTFAGKTLVGDWASAKIYELDLDTFTENGTRIQRIRVAPHLTNNGKYEFLQSLELFMQTGTGMPVDVGFSFMSGLPAGATLTRATAGNYYNSSGALTSAAINVPRFTYNPSTLALLGLMVEPATTNLFPYPDALNTIDPTAFNRVTITTPAADLLVEGVSASAVPSIQCFYPVVVGNTYSWSCTAKPYTSTPAKRFLAFRPARDSASDPFRGAIFDVDLGVVGSLQNCTAQIESAGGTSYRCGATSNFAATASFATQHFDFQLSPIAGATGLVASYACDGSSGVRATHCQIEIGRITSFIIGSRSADVLTLNWGSKGVADGQVTIRYLFDDGSTQDVMTIVSGGLATVPTTLNRLIIQAATTVTPAPVASLSWSDDGGYSYGNEITASVGALGARKTRVIWRRLGRSRDRVFKVVINDPIKVVFTGSALKAVGGSV